MELLWFFEGLRTPFWDTIFRYVTRLGEELTLIVIFCLLFWCINKHIAYVTGFSFFVSGLLVQGLKIIFRVPRPWVYDPSFPTVEGVTSEATGYAFPSGHTQAAAAVLGSLGAQIKRKPIKFILFLLVFAVAFSRIYLGVHYLSDVLVSLAISFALIFIALKLITKEVVSIKRELIISCAVIGLVIVVLIIAFILYQNGISTESQIRDAILSSGKAFGFAVAMFVERNFIRFSVKTNNIFLQIVKFVLGLGTVILVQEGLRVLGSGLVAVGLRYFLLVIYAAVVYPLIIKYVFAKNENAGKTSVMR